MKYTVWYHEAGFVVRDESSRIVDIHEIVDLLNRHEERFEATKKNVFDASYPDKLEISFEGTDLICLTPHPCKHCGEETHWFDLLFGEYTCSDVCNRELWDKFREKLEIWKTTE